MEVPKVDSIERKVLDRMVDDLWDFAYKLGHKDGLVAEGFKDSPLEQINRMAKQIEESHATIRRRNETIKKLQNQIKELSSE